MVCIYIWQEGRDVVKKSLIEKTWMNVRWGFREPTKEWGNQRIETAGSAYPLTRLQELCDNSELEAGRQQTPRP